MASRQIGLFSICKLYLQLKVWSISNIISSKFFFYLIDQHIFLYVYKNIVLNIIDTLNSTFDLFSETHIANKMAESTFI